jgi:hypothetical protein
VLTPNLDGWILVIAGFWNPAIFRAPWVSERLFRVEQIEVQVPLAPTVPVVFRSPKVALRISSTRLEVMPRSIDADALAAAENAATTALELLGETPVSAVGVNFGFQEDAPAPALLELFNFGDAGRWGGQGWQAQVREVTRKFERDGMTLNVRLIFDGTVVQFDFNFNFEVETAPAAFGKLRDQTLHLRTTATMILHEVYGLEISERQ